LRLIRLLAYLRQARNMQIFVGFHRHHLARKSAKRLRMRALLMKV
jgi:hypothetical protein